MNWSRVLALFVGAVLVATGVGKLIDVPGFVDVIRAYQLIDGLAADHVERASRAGASQVEHRLAAQVHVMREDWQAARAALEAALATGGPLDAQVRRELAQVRERAAFAERLRRSQKSR